MTSLHSLVRTVLLCALAGAALCLTGAGALAQGTVPPSKPDCGVKPQHPGSFATDKQRSTWRTQATAYLECYRQYVVVKREWAKECAKAANEAVDEYNAAGKEIEQASKE